MVDLDAWRVDRGYWDVQGRWREPAPEALERILQALGADDGPPPAGPPTWFVRAGHPEHLHDRCDLVLEDGTTLAGIDALPPDLPPGYHDLRPLDGGPTTLVVVTPGRCHLPHDLRTWGWAVQLYAARSRNSWGIGDLADLRALGRWAASEGAGVLSVSPLHAPSPGARQQPSPYYPSSRRFLNPLHLRVEDVPGAAESGADLDRLATAGRALLGERRIDRDRVWALKREALERCFALVEPGPSLPSDTSLREWATFCAIADEHGQSWQEWPAELRHPASPAVAAYARAHVATVAFHAWLQGCLDRQLADAGREIGLIQDLAVGFDPGGADAWAFQESLALGARVGAPPDDFNEHGQDWGLPPLHPHRLREARFRPFIESLRSGFRHAGGLRVDHVMGLFRLFWLPADGGAADGTFVRYPASDLLDILALESWRARAFVVGEDLGTVGDDIREELHRRAVLSYRLLWFEPAPPEHWPEQALAAVTTHDLPTVAGLWTGADPAASDFGESRERLRTLAGLRGDEPMAEVAVAAHRSLARSPSSVVLATLEDACLVPDRPNLPGTVEETNWSLSLPCTIEELAEDPVATAIGDVLRR